MSSASAQYYTREQSIADRASDIRYEAAYQQQQCRELQKKQSNLLDWKYDVDRWASNTQARAQALAQQSKQVDRAAFFANQTAAINQADAQQIKAQGQAVYAAAQQVALRTEQVRSFERQLWQWKAMLDTQDAQLKARLDNKDAVQHSTTEINTANNQRLDVLMKSVHQQFTANAEREKKLAEQEAALKARQASLNKRFEAANAQRDKLDKATESLTASGISLDKLSEALDEQRKALDQVAKSKQAAETAPDKAKP